MTREQLGKEMINEGQWAEFYQNKDNSFMYEWHHERYMKLMEEYHQ